MSLSFPPFSLSLSLSRVIKALSQYPPLSLSLSLSLSHENIYSSPRVRRHGKSRFDGGNDDDDDDDDDDERNRRRKVFS